MRCVRLIIPGLAGVLMPAADPPDAYAGETGPSKKPSAVAAKVAAHHLNDAIAPGGMPAWCQEVRSKNAFLSRTVVKVGIATANTLLGPKGRLTLPRLRSRW